MPYKDRYGRTCGFVDFETEQEQSGRFKRRYFMISPEDASFYCYMDNPNNLPDGATPTADIKLGHISNARDATKQRPKVEFCFVVQTPDRCYYFSADNEEDLQEWVRALNGASRIMVPDAKPAAACSGDGLLAVPSNTGMAQPQNGGGGGGEGEGGEKLQAAYKTEIVAGVVVRTKMEHPVDSDSEDDSRSRSLPRTPPRSPSPVPPLSLNRNTGPFSPKNVIKSGYGVKQGGVRKNWKRRFFILDENGLSYFKSETDKIPLRTIPKKDITSCKRSDIPLSNQRDNLFEVMTGTRTFYVQAYTPDEMADWVKQIRMVVAGKTTPSSEQS